MTWVMTMNYTYNKIPVLNFVTSYRCTMDKHSITRCLQGIERSCFGFLIKGRCTLNQRGRSIPAESGELIYIPKRCRYISEWFGEPEIDFYGTAFEFELPNSLPRYDLQRVPLPNEEVAKRAGDIMRTMYESHDEHDSDILVQSLFLMLFHTVKPYLIISENCDAQNQADTVAKGREYIDEHFTSNFPMSLAAEECGLSESYFYRAFRRSEGITPVEYRTALRVRLAAELLECGKYSVEEVCGMTGFSSTAHFRNVFREYTGENPKEYSYKRHKGWQI